MSLVAQANGGIKVYETQINGLAWFVGVKPGFLNTKVTTQAASVNGCISQLLRA